MKWARVPSPARCIGSLLNNCLVVQTQASIYDGTDTSLDLFSYWSINFLYLSLVRTMFWGLFVCFNPNRLKNKSGKPGSDFTDMNQFVPVKGDRHSSLTSVDFRQGMPVCPIFLSYKFKRIILREMRSFKLAKLEKNKRLPCTHAQTL